jgi:hypothetical protein
MRYLFIILLLFSPNFIGAQSIIDEISDDNGDESVVSSLDLPTETIEKIGASRTVYILSNNNSSFGKGDFISLVINNNLINRAIVAKVSGSSAGIKIVKTYNAQFAQMMRPGTQVQVIRGDDSYFTNMKKNIKKDQSESLIEDEDDLFNETTLLSEDSGLDENTKRLIRTDHLLFGTAALLGSIDSDANSTRLLQVGFNYSYQLADNIWGEAFVTQSKQTKFPAEGISTTLTNITLRGKYTVKLPAYSYLMPYVGIQMVMASTDVSELSNEDNALVNQTKETNIAFGVTLLKRLVPGWFIRADLGTDIAAAGLGIEF